MSLMMNCSLSNVVSMIHDFFIKIDYYIILPITLGVGIPMYKQNYVECITSFLCLTYVSYRYS